MQQMSVPEADQQLQELEPFQGSTRKAAETADGAWCREEDN